MGDKNLFLVNNTVMMSINTLHIVLYTCNDVYNHIFTVFPQIYPWEITNFTASNVSLGNNVFTCNISLGNNKLHNLKYLPEEQPIS